MTPTKAMAPLAAGLATAGTGVLAYNAAAHISHWSLMKDNSLSAQHANFLGQQDMVVAGALFVGFAALTRATYLFMQGNKGASRDFFKLAGGMIAAAGIYALTVGVLGTPVHGSKIGNFSDMNTQNSAFFGTLFSALTVMGGALMAVGVFGPKSGTFTYTTVGASSGSPNPSPKLAKK